MPRSRGGAAPRRSAPTAAPSRPTAPPSASAPQNRGMTTAATHPGAQAGRAPAAQQAPGSQGPGLFGQMASTAAGVAVGSSIGHAIGGFFGGGSSTAAPEQQQQQAAAYQGQDQYASQYDNQSSWAAQDQQQQQGVCMNEVRNFTQCMDQQNGNMSICGWYMDQLKACQKAASPY